MKAIHVSSRFEPRGPPIYYVQLRYGSPQGEECAST